MFGKKRFLAVAAFIVGSALVAGCNSHIDDPGGPDVVLEVDNPTIPPITASLDTTTGFCTFTVTNATASFKNKPKNSLGGSSPFNDIILQSVTVSYLWDDGLGVSGPTVFGVGGSVPANGTASGQFAVVNLGDLVGRDGHTAALTLVFHGETVGGDAVTSKTGGTLSVGSCS